MNTSPYCLPGTGWWYNSSMNEKLNQHVHEALEANNGCVVGTDFVLMSLDVCRNTMGVGSDEELRESLAAIQRSWNEAGLGKARPFSEAMEDIRKQHGLPG